MKAVLTNKIFLDVDQATSRRIKEELTYRIPTYGDGPPMIVHNYGVFREGILMIPIGRTDLIPAGHTVVDKRLTVPIQFPEFKATLRDSQQELYDLIDDNCLINAKVGWGKTYMALALAAK